jgi:hypothetical protein
VAGAGQKHAFRELSPPPDGTVVFFCCEGPHCNVLQAQRPDYVLNSAAVAVSTDGRTWRTVALPGAEVSSSADGDTASNGSLVVFIKHRRKPPDPDIKGFFIATSQTGSSLPDGPHHGRLYKSENGESWEIISTENDRGYQYLSAIAEKLRNTVVV